MSNGDEPRKSVARQSIELLVSTLTLLGILLYGVVYGAYDKFYGELGVDPSDVGFGYASILAHSTGFLTIFFRRLAYFSLYPAVLVIGLIVALRFFAQSSSITNVVFAYQWRRQVVTICFFAIVVPALVLALLEGPYGELLKGATRRADLVTAGHAVQPMRGKGGYLTLAVHADPVSLEVVNKPEESPAIKRLKALSLLYLGQANNLLVLYDVKRHRAIYVPSSSVVITVTNCERSTDPRCH
jgi:hypothetical protein